MRYITNAGTAPAVLLAGIVYAMWWFHYFGVSAIVTLVFVAAILCAPLMKRPSLSQNEVNILVYFTLVFGLLFLLSFSLPIPEESLARLIPTFIFSCVAFLGASRLARFVLSEETNLVQLVNTAFSVLFVIFILGFFFVPGFSSGGMGGLRLSGGINPNAAGGIALYGLIWASLAFHFSTHRSKFNGLLMLLAVICIALSFSRTAMLAAVVYLALVATLTFDKRFWWGIAVALVILSGLGGILSYFVGQYQFEQYLIYAERRLIVDFGDANFSSRVVAWNVMYQAFLESPVLGHFGWYGATRYLSDLALEYGAASPHNLHLRLLSEVGLIGYILLLLLPAFAIVCALIKSVSRQGYQYNGRMVSILYRKIAAALLAIFFIAELFEDRFMTSYINITTLFVFFLIALVFNAADLRLRTYRN